MRHNSTEEEKENERERERILRLNFTEEERQNERQRIPRQNLLQKEKDNLRKRIVKGNSTEEFQEREIITLKNSKIVSGEFISLLAFLFPFVALRLAKMR